MDRYRKLVDRLRGAALAPGAHMNVATLRAAEQGGDVPEPLRAFVDKVRKHAYKVTDQDIEALIAAGYTEDQIFELSVSVAVGEGLRRYEIALAALRAADTRREAG